MKKLRVSPALLSLCAAVLLFVGAFFLGRASALGEARITVQRAAPASDALQIDGSGEGKLCLNTATREELLALPGVGEKTADRILSYRDTYGRFSAVEQLLDVEGIGHIDSFKDQGIDVEFTGMDYFAVRSSVDDSKKEVLTNFIAEVYADPEFQEFMKGMGMEAWEATESEIVDMVEAQTEAMTEYIPLVQ